MPFAGPVFSGPVIYGWLALCLTLFGCEARDAPEILVESYVQPQELPSFLMPRPSQEPPSPVLPKRYRWSPWLILVAALPFLWILKRLFFRRRRNKKVIIKKKE